MIQTKHESRNWRRKMNKPENLKETLEMLHQDIE